MSTNIQVKTNIRKGFVEKLKKLSETVNEGETGIFDILGQRVKIVHGELPADGDINNVAGKFKNESGQTYHFFIQ